jgi:hypothetical protein
MGAIILFEFPSDQADARSWILDRAAVLAIGGKAELKFVGTEQVRCGRVTTEMIALEFENIECASSILSEWRRDTLFPGFLETRLLQIECVNLAAAIFP